MPIYEYRCSGCRRRFSILVGMLANQPSVVCPVCGGTDLSRCVSRFARLRSEDETLESLTDEGTYGDVEGDPRAMQRWARDMGAAMGEDLGEELGAAADEEAASQGALAERAEDAD